MAKSPATPVPQTPLPNVIGVSGAPGGQFDEECARVALDKIKDRMK